MNVLKFKPAWAAGAALALLPTAANAKPAALQTGEPPTGVEEVGNSSAGQSSGPSHALFTEVDPLPFIQKGYGVQVGYRMPRIRFALASFALDVPDAAAEIGDGNDGFHLKVLPSTALYTFYFLSDARGGFMLGGALRYLRIEYTHDDFPGQATRAGEFSVEALFGYKWHPWSADFYAIPWLGLSRTLARTEDPDVGTKSYSPLPIQPFFTVNLGWEFAL